MDPNVDSNTEASPYTTLSSNFLSWLKSRPGVSINPCIAIADFRAEDAGRGVSCVLPSFFLSCVPLSSCRLHEPLLISTNAMANKKSLRALWAQMIHCLPSLMAAPLAYSPPLFTPSTFHKPCGNSMKSPLGWH